MPNSRLEDFGVRNGVSPKERAKDYCEQSKTMPKTLRAKFLLSVKEHDPEAAKELGFKIREKNRRRTGGHTHHG